MRPRSWDNHKPCPGGCGELDDECMCRLRRMRAQEHEISRGRQIR